MSEKEKKEFSAALVKVKAQLANDKEAAKQFFIAAGILMSDGTLAEPFQHLASCIPQNQA